MTQVKCILYILGITLIQSCSSDLGNTYSANELANIESQENSCDCLIKSAKNKIYEHSNDKIVSLQTGNGFQDNLNILFKFDFDGNRLIRKERFNDNQLFSYSIYNYNENDTLPYNRILYWANGDFMSRSDYDYNEKGYLIEKRSYFSDLELSSKFKYTDFDDNGNPLLEIRGVEEVEIIFRYTYDTSRWHDSFSPMNFPIKQTNNLLSRHYRNIKLNGSWVEQVSYGYKYNDCGLPIESYTTDADGVQTVRNEFLYVCK